MKLGEWEGGRQERDTRISSLVDNSHASARERNKKMEEDIQKMRDEFELKMVETKKAVYTLHQPTNTTNISVNGTSLQKGIICPFFSSFLDCHPLVGIFSILPFPLYYQNPKC